MWGSTTPVEKTLDRYYDCIPLLMISIISLVRTTTQLQTNTVLVLYLVKEVLPQYYQYVLVLSKSFTVICPVENGKRMTRFTCVILYHTTCTSRASGFANISLYSQEGVDSRAWRLRSNADGLPGSSRSGNRIYLVLSYEYITTHVRALPIDVQRVYTRAT